MSQVLEQPIREVREQLSEVVRRASVEPTIITRNGKRVAAIVSYDMLQRFEELDEAETLRVVKERLANTAPGIPLEDVIRETMARSD
ncbi:MAG: type II toxin-antitoxin system Phd/YefM family antitoxin [Propionibacteriaceae bacterium]|nr:type II toxin-antitoxin system Phd/YefM family antitoxin [Propionibacteriaceae bacterium]